MAPSPMIEALSQVNGLPSSEKFTGWNGLAGLQDLGDSWAGQDPWASWIPGWHVKRLLDNFIERAESRLKWQTQHPDAGGGKKRRSKVLRL